MIYLDFASAFDKVDHGIPCHKLRQLGITDLGVWFNRFLTDIYQFVRVLGGCSFLWPQCTVLGPLFFLILIHDSDAGVESDIVSFADDTIAGATAESMRYQTVIFIYLDLVYKWSSNTNMSFNSSLSITYISLWTVTLLSSQQMSRTWVSICLKLLLFLVILYMPAGGVFSLSHTYVNVF